MSKRSKAHTVLITGGGGLMGSNLIERLLAEEGTRVFMFHNLSRQGVEQNLACL